MRINIEDYIQNSYWDSRQEQFNVKIVNDLQNTTYFKENTS